MDDIGQVEQWTGSGQNWTLLGSLLNNLCVGGANNNVYATDELTGDIKIYDGSPNLCTAVGGLGAQFAVSRTALYGLAPDSSYVARYPPLGAQLAEHPARAVPTATAPPRPPA